MGSDNDLVRSLYQALDERRPIGCQDAVIAPGRREEDSLLFIAAVGLRDGIQALFHLIEIGDAGKSDLLGGDGTDRFEPSDLFFLIFARYDDRIVEIQTEHLICGYVVRHVGEMYVVSGSF